MPEAELSSLPTAGSSDPWSNWRAFHNLGDRSPFDVLAFTERWLLREHWDRRHHYDQNIPRALWERIQSCDPLKALCAPYSSKHFTVTTGYPPGHSEAVERLYAAIELLEWFHWREAGFGSPIRPGAAPGGTRKQQRRYWEAQLRGLKRAAVAVENTHDLLLTTEGRERISSILLPAMEKAAQFAKNPPWPGGTIVIAQECPSDPETERRWTFYPNLNPDPPKRGRPRDTGSPLFAFNLETALLDEFLLPVARGKRRWKLLLDLLRHFNPDHFTPLSLHALRNRVQWFRKEHLEVLQDHKQRYLARARHHIGTRPA